MVAEQQRVLVIRHELCSSLGLLGESVQQAAIPVKYLDVAAGETLSEPIERYSHLVILGGPISAFEDDIYPFLRYEFTLIEQAIAHQIPTLGICLGSQVLAKVLGANVYRGESGREAGWCDLQLTESGQRDLLFQDFPTRFKVFESHQDTFDIPKGSVHLATSNKYPNQAFCYNEHVWAIQFHLEMSAEVLQDCAAIIEKELEESKIQDTTLEQLLVEARSHAPTVKPLADSLMSQFLKARVKEAV